jgi:hypothetical protein
MPEEETLLQRSEIGRGLLRNAFKGKGLCRGQHIVKTPNDRKGRLSVVSNGDAISCHELQIGLVPLEDVSAPCEFSKENLRAEETSFQVGKVVSFTLEDSNASGVVKDFVSKAPLLVGNQLTGDSIQRKWRWEIHKRSRNKIREAGTDALGAP